MPYKRFVADWLVKKASEYLNVAEARQQTSSSRATYRSVVTHDRQKIGYPVQPAEQDKKPGHQPVIPPSLVWRFLGWLGRLSLSLEKARELILQSEPNSTCHRQVVAVDPFQARSPERLVALETAGQLLQVMPEWERCFERPLFPQFATRSGFS